MSKYSERARRNLRKQVNGRIAFYRTLLTGHKAELAKIKRYAKYGLPGQRFMERAAGNRIKKTKLDLRNAITRKALLKRQGKI